MNTPQDETVLDQLNKLEERIKKVETFFYRFDHDNDKLLNSFKFKAAVREVLFEHDFEKWNIENEVRLRVIIKRLLRDASLKVEFQ